MRWRARQLSARLRTRIIELSLSWISQSKSPTNPILIWPSSSDGSPSRWIFRASQKTLAPSKNRSDNFAMTDIILISGHKNTENIFSDEILCLLKVRNEILRIHSVLAHHRSIGVNRFFIVDNCSDDGTVDFLMSQSDVALFSAHAEFKSSQAGSKWLHSILDTFCQD